MKDNRFTELLNLYIDRQITAAEAADLEAEIQASPQRRAIYRQYCQMHRATTLVYDSFRAGAPEQEGQAGKASVARFEDRPQGRRHWLYYAGGLAAACLAVVLVRQNFTHAPEANLSGPAAKPAMVALAHPVTGPAVKPAASPAGLGSVRNNDLAAAKDYAALLVALRQEEQRAFANGQIQPARLPSLFEDGVFENQPGFQPANQRVFRSKQSSAPPAEFTAFQFQR